MSKKETLKAIKEAKEHIASIKNGAQITETVDLSSVDAMLKSCHIWNILSCILFKFKITTIKYISQNHVIYPKSYLFIQRAYIFYVDNNHTE